MAEMIRTSTFTLFRPPTASTLPFCRACNIFLYGSRQFTNFAEKQCPAVGLNEFAAMLFSSACKNVFLVPEQSRLDQVLGQSAAINRDKRLRAPRAAAMDRARDQLFPDTGFAFNQNRSDGRRRFCCGFEDR